MAIERWGALSVADHTHLPNLVANVLLYDRLVMPMYTESGDRDERAYWLEKAWDPDGQRARRGQLGELVIACAWDKARRDNYRNRYQAAKQLDAEANGEMVTRWLLTEEPHYPLPTGVNHADIFVAYNSQLSAEQELCPQHGTQAAPPINWDTLDEEVQVGVLIAHELGVPDIAEPEVALREAIALARETEFRHKRAELYEFQMSCLNRGMSAKAIVAELRDRNQELKQYLAKQHVPTRKKAGFMLAQTAVGVLVGAFGHPLGAIGGLLGLWQFATFDAKANEPLPTRLAPVAAFHDVEKRVGLTL